MFRRSMSLVLTIVAVSLCLSVTEPYAEFWPMTGPESLPLVNCRWQDADRTTLLVEGEHYALRVAMNPVKILGLSIDGQEQLGPDGMSIGILDSEGTIYSPDSDSTARWNVWRCGPYYWDAHLLEIPFSDAAGGTVASGEIIFHIHSDRCHIEILVAPEKESLYSAKAVWACDPLRASTARADARPALSLNTCWALGTNGSRFSSDGKAWVAPLRQKDNRVHTYWVLRPGSPDLSPKYLFQEELDPLHKDGVSVADGFWMGYDPAAGFYEVSCDNGMIRGGFESWFKNPSRRLGTAIGIESDRDREMLIKYSSGSAGTLEASVLTDGNGFPYPIVVQACKNFGGEKEEPDDTPFSESYFPVSLKAKETTEFNAVHLFQNWGNHPLTQFSSIRFFTIYWHLSTGVTETTCYPLNPMTASAPGAKRFFSIADYRPMSGVMWPAQPQHHHVALQGFLQYETESGVQNMVYERTITKSIAPNLAHFSMFYHTTDDAAKCAIDAFEIPQLDETRAFVRIRYDFEKPVEIAGDARLNFRILNKGTYIRQIRFPKVTWSDPDNAIRSEDIRYDSQPTLLGEMMGGECPFACMYPHEDGNDSVIVRSYRARLGGTDYEAPALSVTGYESSRENRAICEMTLTVKDEALKIQPGDFVEADLILMPYGDKGSSYHQPNLERTYYGAQAPKVQVSTGEKIADFPTVVRAKGDEASFTLSGGFDYVPITVTGLEGWRAPLLWEGNSWIDQQVHGGDGYQVQPDGEGGYQCTFVYPTRRDQSHGFHVTRAGCSTGIEKMFYDNGDVVIESEQVGEFSLKAPLLFAPGRNRILKDSPIYSFSGRASKIRSAHLSCGPDSDTLVVNVREPRKGTFRVDVEEGSGRLTFRGLPPRTLYKVKAGNDSWDEASSSSGDLAVMMERPGTVVLREHPKQIPSRQFEA